MNRRLWSVAVLFLGLLLSRCIGTDILELVVVPERVEITRMVQELEVGTTFRFEADFFDSTGAPSVTDVQWSSTEPAVISITLVGEATALEPGIAYIVAHAGSLRDSVLVEAGEETVMVPTGRTGTFIGLNNYRVSGGFSVEENANGDGIVLTFADDFNSQNGPGLYVYMSNMSTSVAGGIEIAELQATRGVQTYNIPGINVRTYDHVLVYCKPFGLPFGAGALSE